MDEVTYNYESPPLDPNQPRWHNAFKRAVYSHQREERAKMLKLPTPKQNRTKKPLAKVPPDSIVVTDNEPPLHEEAR